MKPSSLLLAFSLLILTGCALASAAYARATYQSAQRLMELLERDGAQTNPQTETASWRDVFGLDHEIITPRRPAEDAESMKVRHSELVKVFTAHFTPRE